MEKKRGIVFLGLSGGVDSAVAAALLLDSGYDVIPIFYKCWEELNAELSCPWIEDQEGALEVARHLGIESRFRTWNFTKEFTKGVIERLAQVARAGGTGNPDIDCNRIVKLGLFYDRALAEGANFIATGHYARAQQRANSKWRSARSGKSRTIRQKSYVLLRAKCEAKNDQTYFLAQSMTQEILSRTLFPIGEFESKESVREEARRRKLPCAERRSSRGICLVGKDGERADYASLLKRFIPSHKGAVMTTGGVRVGTHEGAAYYTRGQRQGLGLTRADGGPYYVVEKDVEANVLRVAPPAIAQELLWNSVVVMKNIHWISGRMPKFPLSCEAFVRHPQDRTVRCVVSRTRADGARTYAENVSASVSVKSVLVRVRFEEPQRALTAGQSIVFYSGEVVLGGGIIQNVL